MLMVISHFFLMKHIVNHQFLNAPVNNVIEANYGEIYPLSPPQISLCVTTNMIHEIETEPFKKENVNNISEINIESTCTNAKKK